jgi:hypothetical protein
LVRILLVKGPIALLIEIIIHLLESTELFLEEESSTQALAITITQARELLYP